MTVSTLNNTTVLVANGSTTVFPFSFLVLDEDHLVVQRRVISTGIIDKTYTSGEYSVTGVGASSGSITISPAPEDGNEIIITRTVPYTQDLEISNQGGFFPEVIEEQLDLMVMQTQQLADITSRTIQLAAGETSPVLPAAAARANKFLIFDVDGNPSTSEGTGADAGLRADLIDFGGAALVGFKALGAGSAASTLNAKAGERLSLDDAGLTGSGDETAKIAARVAGIKALNRIAYLGPISVNISATLELDGTGNMLAGLIGEGPERSKLVMTSNSVDLVKIGGQYMEFGRLSLEYATQQYRGHTPSGALRVDPSLSPGGFGFGSVRQLMIRGAYYGLYAPSSTAGLQQNITYDMIRCLNCFGAGINTSSVGSGSIYPNIYLSNNTLPNCLSMAIFGDHSGYAGLLNVEQACVGGAVVNFALANNFRINSVHCENVSLMRSGTTLDAAAVCCFIQTSAQGSPSIGELAIDTCHVGSLIVTSMTRTGSTARAYLDVMGMFHKVWSGSAGIEVGDSCFIEGANAAEYNGAHTVTAAGATESAPGSGVWSDHWIEFTVSGTPVTPAAIASGSDCITANRGTTVVSSIPLVYATGSAREFTIDNLYLRDVRVVGATAARRRAMLRLLTADSTVPMTLRIKNISTAGQRSSFSHLNDIIQIEAYERTSNVTKIYTTRPLALRADSVLNIYGAADTSFNGKTSGTLTRLSESDFCYSFAQTGSDVAYTPTSTTKALLQTFIISTVERASNYAIITFTAAHGLSSPIATGLSVAIKAVDSAYDRDNAMILDVPSTTSIKVRNVGLDEASKADAGTVQLFECGISPTNLLGSAAVARLFLPDDWTRYFVATNASAVAAGATVLMGAVTVLNATVSRHTVQLEVVDLDPRLIWQAKIGAANTVYLYATNPGAGSITPAAGKAIVQVMGG